MTNHQLEPTTQQLLTALLQSGVQQQQSLDRLREKIRLSGEQQRHSLDVPASRIGYRGEKIDHRTRVVAPGFSELTAIVQEQAEIEKQQVESISRFAATVERQAQIIERLLLREPGQ